MGSVRLELVGETHQDRCDVNISRKEQGAVCGRERLGQSIAGRKPTPARPGQAVGYAKQQSSLGMQANRFKSIPFSPRCSSSGPGQSSLLAFTLLWSVEMALLAKVVRQKPTPHLSPYSGQPASLPDTSLDASCLKRESLSPNYHTKSLLFLFNY